MLLVLELNYLGIIQKTERKTELERKKIVLLLATPPLDLDAITKEKKELLKLKSKPTVNIELAGAYLGSSINNTYKNLSATKEGLWLNLRWSPKIIPFDLVGVTRYSWAIGTNAKNSKDSSFWDYGLNLSYQQRNFDLAVEYVNRRDLANKLNYDRLAFVANYQIIEGIVAVASFGKDFNKASNIFTVLGVKFSLSGEKANVIAP